MQPNIKKELQRKDRQYVWHPFTQMKDYANQDHLLIEKAEGIFLYDADGKRYYDTVSSWWVNLHGHSHPRIRQAISKQMEQMDHVMFSGLTHPAAIELAKQLVEITPNGLDRVFYSDNGSTAVEVALKMSFQYWQHLGKKEKVQFVYMNNSYHGDTIGAVSVGGVEQFHSLYRPLLFPAFKVSSPSDEDVSQCLKEVEHLFSNHAREIAAFIIEPMIQAAGGMLMYPASYLVGIRELCDQYQVHLIADEVATGFGRTGRMFACEHAQISPDLMCLSKGLTAGVMPLSVTLCTDQIYQGFYDDYETLKTFFHGHSFTANPLACAVALESLQIFKDDEVLQHVSETSPYLEKQFNSFDSFEHVGNLRSLGMVAAFDLYANKQLKERYDFSKRTGYQVYKAGLEEGLILRPLGDTMYYWLPLCTTKKDIDDIIDRTKRVLQRLDL